MAHFSVEGEEERYFEMIATSPPLMDFGDFSAVGESKNTHAQRGHDRGISEQEYALFLGQSLGFQKPVDTQHQWQTQSATQERLQHDPVMYANPNQPTKVESPGFLSPTSMGMGTGFRSHNTEFLGTPLVYLEALSNANSFHDAVSHFSGIADPPSSFLGQAQHHDTFSQEIGLGGSISSTNLADMNMPGHGLYADSVYPRSTQANALRVYNQGFHPNDAALVNDGMLNQDTWRYDISSQQQDAFQTSQADAFQSLYNQIQTSNKLTEDNLTSYNGTGHGTSSGDAQVTISIEQAPELVAARTPSLFSNSSHNSPLEKKPEYASNQLQPPGQQSRSRSPSLSLQAPSPLASWNSSPSPNLVSLASPGESVYSDVEADAFLRPEDYGVVRRGRQAAHLLKVRSKLHSRSGSRSRSRSGSVASTPYEDDSDAESTQPPEDSDAARSSREKMLELASLASVSKRTQIHPSSYACHLCEKKFTRPYNLKSHLRTHTDDRPFICNVCGKAFARQHDRKRHEELHSGEKKYQCRGILRDGTPFGCGRKFARADALRRHFQTESGRECIKLLVEEDTREQNTDAFTSGIQLPDGEFMNPNAPEVPVVSVLPPQ